MFNNNRYGLTILSLLFPLITQADGLPITSIANGVPHTSSIAPALPASLLTTAILASSTVTNTGPTVVQGDLDVFPGTAITGFPPGVIVNGTLHSADVASANAHAGAQTYYNSLVAQTCPAGNNLTGQDLGGKTLSPGVYCFDSSAQLTGVLTLKGKKRQILHLPDRFYTNNSL